MRNVNRFTRGEEIANAILHGIGLGLAIAALIVLVVLASIYGSALYIVSFSIYGTTLVILYLASTLLHSFPEGKAKNIFEIMDHSAIYLLIAGTYTPLALIALGGTLGWIYFGVVWSLALLGVIFKIIFIKRFVILSTLLYIAMGWLIVFALSPLFHSLTTKSLIFLVIGGVVYTIGTIFYIWHKIKFHHAIWHLFVLGGSVCHFFTILFMLPGEIL